MSDPLVEGLLEKGARAISPTGVRDDIRNGDYDAWAKAQVTLVLDAVLPGWREGISREWQTTYGGNRVGLPGDRQFAQNERDDWARDVPVELLGFASRLVLPWLPVEDGTQ